MPGMDIFIMVYSYFGDDIQPPGYKSNFELSND
jgi:hypothetical protein